MANRRTNVANFWETTLSSQMGASDLTANVVDTTGLSSPAYLVIEPDDPNQREVIYFDGTFTGTTFATTTLTNRYLPGSAAASGLVHPAGSVVRAAPVAQHLDDVNDRVTSHGHTGGDDGPQLDHQQLTNLVGHVTGGDLHDHSGGDGAQIDHGGLAGLGDDDHSQYLNNARHDTTARHGASVVDHGQIGGLGDDDHPQYLQEAELTFAEVGDLTVKTGTMRWYAPFAMTIQDIRASVGSAPEGTVGVVVDVNKNGASLFPTSAKPTIAPTGNTDVATPDTTAVAAGDYLTVDIDQIGDTTPGSDLVVTVRYRR